MQLMTWAMGRLGSRFGLLFEPYRHQVMHSGLGRFLDEPLDLCVGLVGADGRERMLPFTKHLADGGGVSFANCEQFERFNSITFRGFAEDLNLRFEFNVHAVFYPQDERLCIMPAYYLEMRVNPAAARRFQASDTSPTKIPKSVRLFIRVNRPDTALKVAIPTTDGESDAVEDSALATIDMAYTGPIHPARDGQLNDDCVNPEKKASRQVDVRDRIVSINPDCEIAPEKDGLYLDLPVTQEGSGIKWRLVWGSYVDDPVLNVKMPETDEKFHRTGENDYLGRLRYTNAWNSLDEVLNEAIEHRDDYLAKSRRFEKLIEQAPLGGSQRHLLNQSWQAYLSNTFWCDLYTDQDLKDLRDESSDREKIKIKTKQWYSVWEGSNHYHSTLDIEYNNAMFYLTLWPRLLTMQFDQWAAYVQPHDPSGGGVLSHDLGEGAYVEGQAYQVNMEVEENSNFLLLLQAYIRWTGDLKSVKHLAPLVRRLVRYLIWSDVDQSGFPDQGCTSTFADAGPAARFARAQTYLAVKRAAAMDAAADILRLFDDDLELARECEHRVGEDTRKIEDQAWLGDHYAVCVDRSAVGLIDPKTGRPAPFEMIPGWDAYTLNTPNGLLLPALIGRPPMLMHDRLASDLLNAKRESSGRYGCGNTSAEVENVRVSQNMWRDIFARYIGMNAPPSTQRYWDLQVMSNTGPQSRGFVDTYVNDRLTHHSRGVAAIGFLLAGTRISIDRLAPDGNSRLDGGASTHTYITVEPDRNYPQRWPLLPLADWKANRIPVCVVHADGHVVIEGKLDPVIIHGDPPETVLEDSGVIG